MDQAELDAALASVFRFDSVALVERCVEDYDAFYTGLIEGLAPDKANTVPERAERVFTSID